MDNITENTTPEASKTAPAPSAPAFVYPNEPASHQITLNKLTFREMHAYTNNDAVAYAENLRDILLKSEPLEALKFMAIDMVCNCAMLLRNFCVTYVRDDGMPCFGDNTRLERGMSFIVIAEKEHRKAIQLYANICKLTNNTGNAPISEEE